MGGKFECCILFSQTQEHVLRVFNDSNASDPTHSVLSKVCLMFRVTHAIRLIPIQDHFGIILNEPAGKVAKVVVEYSVNLIVEGRHTDVPFVRAGY